MTAFTMHASYDFKTGLRNPSQLFMYYLFPLGVYLVLSLVMTQINPLFRESIIPAMILLAGMATFLLGLPGPLVEARQAGVYRNFRINGVPGASILFIPVLTTFVHFLIVAIVITVTGGMLFHGSFPTSWPDFVMVTVLVAIVYGMLGALISVIASNARVVMMLTQLIFLPSMLIGGMMVPLSMLPGSIRTIAYLLPTTHLMQAYHAFAFGGTEHNAGVVSLLVSIVAAAIALALSVALYRWDAKPSGRRNLVPAALLLVPYIASIVLLR